MPIFRAFSALFFHRLCGEVKMWILWKSYRESR